MLNLEESILYGEKLRAIANLIAKHKYGLDSKTLQKKTNFDSYKLQCTLQLGVSLGILDARDIGQAHQYQVVDQFLDWARQSETPS